MRILKILSCYLLFICFLQNMGCASSKISRTAMVVDSTTSAYKYLVNYFVLSENREIENWYNTYLSECNQFYKIENPTKDTILNLIKSYWVTSNQQKHIITKIEKLQAGEKSIYHVTMNYSYNIIATNVLRSIPNLKLEMILNKRKKVISIREIARG
jgi:actin-related protein